MKKPIYLVLVALALLLLALGLYWIVENLPDPPPETEPPESFAPAPDSPVTCTDGLDKDDYPVGTTVGDWLASCSSEDRNDHVDAYILCHIAEAGESVTYTYLVYYPHGDSGYVATPSVSVGDSGTRRVDIRYAPTSGRADYALTHITVTLPKGSEPLVSVLREEEGLGVMMSMTGKEVSPAAT